MAPNEIEVWSIAQALMLPLGLEGERFGFQLLLIFEVWQVFDLIRNQIAAENGAQREVWKFLWTFY